MAEGFRRDVGAQPGVSTAALRLLSGYSRDR